MKVCPIHGTGFPFYWHRCSNVTKQRHDGNEYFLLAGCTHCDAFLKREQIAFVKKQDREAVEKRWENEAETLFATYTARWTDDQRANFRARLWPVEKPDLLAEALKKFNDALK